MTSPWRIRGMVPEDTRDIIRLWLSSFWDSRYARRFHYPGGKRDYEAKHGARIRKLLERSDVRIACDPSDENIWYAFAVVEGASTVHYAFVKRSFHRNELSADLLRELLADRLDRACTYSHELCEFKKYEAYIQGLRIPDNWILDEYSWSEAA